MSMFIRGIRKWRRKWFVRVMYESEWTFRNKNTEVI